MRIAPTSILRLNRAIRVPQRVVGYRATSRFFLRLSGFVSPNRRLSPKSAKSPAASYRPCRRHVGGTGSERVLSDTTTRAIRPTKTRDCARYEFRCTNLVPQEKARRAVRGQFTSRGSATIYPCYNGVLRVPDSAAATPLARTKAFCQWFSIENSH